MLEAATLGMPFEVWKTRMGRFRNENTIQSFIGVWKAGGGGLKGWTYFWRGLTPKLVEAGSKGAVLLWSKELILDALLSLKVNATCAGLLAGAGGGVIQTSVMAPCTFLVTCVVTHGNKSILAYTRDQYKKEGIKGFYHGAGAIAARQASNWASRQGFTELVRDMYKRKNKSDKLTPWQEVWCGVIGGALSCWNHPFEVARIEAQARAVHGESKMGMMEILKHVHSTHGINGLFKGLVPRLLLCIWQTVFMVSFAKVIKQRWADQQAAKAKAKATSS